MYLVNRKISHNESKPTPLFPQNHAKQTQPSSHSICSMQKTRSSQIIGPPREVLLPPAAAISMLVFYAAPADEVELPEKVPTPIGWWWWDAIERTMRMGNRCVGGHQRFTAFDTYRGREMGNYAARIRQKKTKSYTSAAY